MWHLFHSVCICLREQEQKQDILTFSSRTISKKKKHTMHLSHPGCVHYPRSRCAKELALNIDCALCPRCHKDLFYTYCHQPRRQRTLAHTNRMNGIARAEPAKNTQPRFLRERDALSLTEPSPKILPETFQRPTGQLAVLGFSRSHSERLSGRQKPLCCLPPLPRSRVQILHNVFEQRRPGELSEM